MSFTTVPLLWRNRGNVFVLVMFQYFGPLEFEFVLPPGLEKGLFNSPIQINGLISSYITPMVCRNPTPPKMD